MAKNRSIVLIAGCGYVGTALGRHLAKAGHTVWGLRRKTGDLSSPLLPLASDVTDLETLQSLPSQIDTVFYTVSPDHSDEAGYRAAYINGLRNLLEVLKTQAQQPRIFYTSSTALPKPNLIFRRHLCTLNTHWGRCEMRHPAWFF